MILWQQHSQVIILAGVHRLPGSQSKVVEFCLRKAALYIKIHRPAAGPCCPRQVHNVLSAEAGATPVDSAVASQCAADGHLEQFAHASKGKDQGHVHICSSTSGKQVTLQ